MAADLIVVYVTAPSEEVGMLIANRLLEMRLAACVNIVPAVHSLYIWKGELTRDDEVLLICKTRADLFTDHFVPAVMEVHPMNCLRSSHYQLSQAARTTWIGCAI